VTHLEDFNKVLREGRIADEIFDKEADAKGACKGPEMFKSSLGVLDGAQRPAVVSLAEVDNEVAKGNPLSRFEGALYLVHGSDATRFFGMQDVDCGSAGAAHFAIRKQGSVHGPRLKCIGSKP